MVEKAPIQAEEITIDPNSGDNLLKVESTLHITPNQIGMPLIVRGPWTYQARWDAAKRDVREATDKYFYDAMKKRNWVPHSDLPLGEMRESGHLLSDDTVTIIQAYLGVEDFVGDYVLDGLNYIGKERERRDAHLVWGMEEAKHATAWELVLLHSGRKSAKELRDYRDEVAQHTWRLKEDHPGLDAVFGVIAYTMLQERATFFNYDEMRKRIRRETGLPDEITPVERARGKEFGAAGAFAIVSRDEIAHHGFFLNLFRIYTRYLPEQMLGAAENVFDGFEMPAIKLIPDSIDLEAAMLRTKLHTPRDQVGKINNPVLSALKFDGRRALKKAAQEAKILPAGLGPQYVAIGKNGEFIQSMHPDQSSEATIPSSDVIFEDNS